MQWEPPAAAVVGLYAGVEHVVLKHGALPFVTAALVSGLLGIIEQRNRLRARFTLENGAVWWWGARIVLELVIGLAAILILRESEPSTANHFWAWIGAGAAGPAVMRLRVLDLERRPIGVATAYEPIRGFIEEQIDQRSAECMSTWINYKVLPRILDTDPAGLVAYVEDFVNSRYRLTPREAQAEIEWLERTRDGRQPDAVKVELIVRRVTLVLGGYRLLERYLKDKESSRRRL